MSDSWEQHLVSIIIGLLVIIGCVVCYTPQVVELLVKNSTKGVSFWTFMLSTLANYDNFLSVTMTSWPVLTFWARSQSTEPVSAWEIADVYVAFFNLFSQFLMPLVTAVTIVLVHLRETNPSRYPKRTSIQQRQRKTLPAPPIFHNVKTPNTAISVNESRSLIPIEPKPEEEGLTTWDLIQRRLIILAYLLSILFVALTWLGGLTCSHFHLSYTSDISDAIAVISSASFFVLWIPQIFTTAFISKGKGSMNIFTLSLLIIGALISAGYMALASRPLFNWLPYFVVAFQQSVVLVLIIVFESCKCVRKRVRERELERAHEREVEREVEEEGMLVVVDETESEEKVIGE